MPDAVDSNVNALIDRSMKRPNKNAAARKTNALLALTDMIFLRYDSEGRSKTGTIIVEYEYSSSDCSINYLNVQYSDPQLSKHVEGNPRVLRNIDSYLRNKLLKLEHKFSYF